MFALFASDSKMILKTMFQIHKLYERNEPEGDSDQVPADLAHHFLLAICTHPGSGVCFKDKGWYPRELQLVPDSEDHKTGKIYNKILANLLKSLKVNDDLRQQELALKIMVACPELVSGSVDSHPYYAMLIFQMIGTGTLQT